MYDWTKGHPYFRTKDKVYKHKEFIQEETETIADVEKKARDWVVSQNGTILVQGGRWYQEPVNEGDKKGPSSFIKKFVISYINKK